MPRLDTLLLSAADVLALLDMRECVSAVDQGFILLGEGKVPPAEILGVHAPHGGLHIKATLWPGERSYFVAKANANFVQNPKQRGLPTIQGVVILSDAETGELLAIMDSIEITALRTAAASAVAAKYLARRQSRVLTICGCGKQGLAHLEALAVVLPLTKVYLYDPDAAARDRCVEAAKKRFTGELVAASDLQTATRDSDVIATCTPSRSPFLEARHVRPGTFIAAVGADNEEKHEIHPALFVGSKIVVDSLSQCRKIGDLHHALEAGTIKEAGVHAELAAVAAKNSPGREAEDEVIIFDSTGIAVEDAAAAVLVFERATRQSGFRSINLKDSPQ
jgi:alanine dehydrogenase